MEKQHTAYGQIMAVFGIPSIPNTGQYLFGID